MNRFLFRLLSLSSLFIVSESALSQPQNKDTILLKDTVCKCEPSLPLEFAATSVFWGIPNYVIWVGTLMKNPNTHNVTGTSFYIIPSLLLLMFTLGPISEW